MKTLTRIVMTMVFVLIVAITLWATDRSPPSFVLAYWVMTREVRPGSQIDIRFIIVRKKAYPTRIEQAVFVNDIRYPLDPIVTNAPPLGLDVFTLSAALPREIETGEARYQPTFIWTDPVNAVHWFWPIQLTLEPSYFTITPDPAKAPKLRRIELRLEVRPYPGR